MTTSEVSDGAGAFLSAGRGWAGRLCRRLVQTVAHLSSDRGEFKGGAGGDRPDLAAPRSPAGRRQLVAQARQCEYLFSRREAPLVLDGEREDKDEVNEFRRSTDRGVDRRRNN